MRANSEIFQICTNCWQACEYCSFVEAPEVRFRLQMLQFWLTPNHSMNSRSDVNSNKTWEMQFKLTSQITSAFLRLTTTYLDGHLTSVRGSVVWGRGPSVFLLGTSISRVLYNSGIRQTSWPHSHDWYAHKYCIYVTCDGKHIKQMERA